MKTLLLTLMLFSCSLFANSISNEKWNIINICVFNGDVARGVQMVRQEGDTLPELNANVRNLFSAYRIDKDMTKAVLLIAADVYENVDEGLNPPTVFITYYHSCVDRFLGEPM